MIENMTHPFEFFYQASSRLYFGADHRGFFLKKSLLSWLRRTWPDLNEKIQDLGNKLFDQSDHYPDFSHLVARKVASSPEIYRGVLICGSGVGASIVANRYVGVRAVLANNVELVRVARKDDDVNLLVLGGDYTDLALAQRLLASFLLAPFLPLPRYVERLRKIENKI